MKNIDRRGKNGPPRTKMCNFDPKNCRRNSQFPKKMAQNFTKMAKNIFSCGIYPYFSLSPFAKPDFFLFCALCSPMSYTDNKVFSCLKTFELIVGVKELRDPLCGCVTVPEFSRRLHSLTQATKTSPTTSSIS